MKSKILLTLIFYCINFFSIGISVSDRFDFNLSEIKILENGNKLWFKRGEVSTSDGFVIEADNFIYEKSKYVTLVVILSLKTH